MTWRGDLKTSHKLFCLESNFAWWGVTQYKSFKYIILIYLRTKHKNLTEMQVYLINNVRNLTLSVLSYFFWRIQEQIYSKDLDLFTV